jgi:putative mRNA 3-end processing factor
MRVPSVDVNAKGAVVLGQSLCCDGFIFDVPHRVQSHVHADHLDGFTSSKGCQDIWMSEPTMDLLVVMYDADLPYRMNIHSLRLGCSYSIGDCELRLLPSGHMLGAVQVEAVLPTGQRVGYSGDFAWPLEQVIEVDSLVLDSTHGSPDSHRNYTQSQVNEEFIDLVTRSLKSGPVHIRANRGTLQRALSLLDGQLAYPIVAGECVCREVEVYRRFGYGLGHVIPMDRSDGLLHEAHIQLHSTSESPPTTVAGGTVITLSAYMSSDRNSPIVEYSDCAFAVAMSDHADFEETLEYVRATGASHVVTDKSRGGKAIELASELRRRLGVEAVPSSNTHSREWGS